MTLSKENFLEVVTLAPLVSVDLVIVRDSREALLGLRNNRPAQGFWFVPGGRILKDETIRAALTRVAEAELGLGAALAAGQISPERLGTFEHFYDDCFAGDIGVSTHYVVLAHLLKVPENYSLPRLDGQHSQLRWWPFAELSEAADVHSYTKDYFLDKTA